MLTEISKSALAATELGKLIDETIIGRNAEHNRKVCRRVFLDGVPYERVADMRAVMDGADGMNGFGGGGAWVLIILFALIFGNGGFFGNRNGGNPVTEADLCNANSFSELKGSVGRLSDQIDNVNTNLSNGLCQLGYSVQGQIAQLSQQVATCCCEIS